MEAKYDLLSPTPPCKPKRIPEFVNKATAPVPDIMKIAAYNAVFPPIAAQMYDVNFRYIDNVPHEPTPMEVVVAPTARGKGYLDPMKENLVYHLSEQDKENQAKLDEYNKQYKKKSANQAKPDRPTDAPIHVIEPDTSNPAFIQLLNDVEREGNRSLYGDYPEIEHINYLCGGHKKVTLVIRANFDTKKYGAHRATPDGVSGKPVLRLKLNIATTEENAIKFFKDGLSDGTMNRIGFSYVPESAGSSSRGIPKQGNYDEKYREELEPYLERLRNAHGTIKVPRINKLMLRLMDEMADIADLSGDKDFKHLYHRALVIAWMKGCILYIADGYRWSNTIADFVEWSLYYDLWSKLALFAPQFQKNRTKVEINPRKYGPTNMLDLMPISFSREQLEMKREDLGKTKDGIAQLCTWKDRNYVTYDEKTCLYTKTELYLAKHPHETQDPQV